MPRAILIFAAVSVCVLPACGSYGGGLSASSRPAITDLAATPEAAALGFEDSLDRNTGFRFACLPGGDFATEGFIPTGPLTASSERVAPSTWAVTLSDEGSGGQPLHRWTVRKIGEGYCVSGEPPTQPPRLSPSSPGSGTGS